MVVVISDSHSEDLVSVYFNPEGYCSNYPDCSFVKTTNKTKYEHFSTNNKPTNKLLVPGLVHVWRTCILLSVVWSFWKQVYVLDYVDWSSYLHSLNGNIN